jgi:hypothetical protein
MSKSILISLIGKETIPNYRAFKEFSPDVLVQVYSKDTENSAAILEKMAADCSVIIPIEVGGFNYIEILNALQSKIEVKEEDHLTINITGGTKMMSLALYEFGLKAQNTCKVFYFYIDLQQKIHWFLENRTEDFSVQLTLEEFITLSGQKISVKDNYSDLATKYKLPLSTVKGYLNHFERTKIWENFLKNVVAVIRKNANNYESVKQTLKRLLVNQSLRGFEIIWDNEGIRILYKDRPFIEISDSDIAIEWFLFNAGWFELITAEKLSKTYPENQIYMNVKFPVLAKMEEDKNEVDILINDGGKLIFIECKSGLVKSENINTIKIRKETYGGMIAQNILVTRYPLELSKSDTTKIIMEKCKELNIQYKTLKDL